MGIANQSKGAISTNKDYVNLYYVLYIMDIVYLLRKSDNDNIEFRYSLRSLKYIKHDKVFVVWYKPRRAKNVIHIKCEDNWEKYENVRRKQLMIFNNDDISEDFVYMNDDFYFLEPQEVKYYKIGTHKEQLRYIRDRDEDRRNRGLWVAKYYENLKYVYDVFGKWDSFETHTPIVFNRKKMLKMLDKYPWLPPTSIRTAYCRYMKIKWKLLPNTPNYKQYKNKLRDCKCYNRELFIVNEWQPLLSTENNMSREPVFLSFMKEKFPELSEYETDFLSNKTYTMLFKAKPKYSVSLSRLVQFDSQGNYQTDDQKLIEELLKLDSVRCVDQEQEITTTVPTVPTTDWTPVELDIVKLREQYKEKFNKKCYGGRTAEQIQQKLAE